jgi:predicted acyltransferase
MRIFSDQASLVDDDTLHLEIADLMNNAASRLVIDHDGVTANPHRWLSIDVLRGLTIGFMIMVNNNGGGSDAYWAMKHADWNGFTPTDLVFPTFLFLVGISTVFSTEARLTNGDSRKTIFLHTLQRSVLLFLLGLLVNSFPMFHLARVRVFGVLQRTAVCYLIIAALYLLNSSWRSKLMIAVAALVGYWAMMRFVPVPGYGIPTHQIPLLDRDGNLVAWLDRQIFTANHLYEKTRDPEGLLSTLPALATALFGMLTGIWLRTSRTIAEKAKGICFAGLGSLLLGGLWSLEFPINKKLWTSSYVLYAAGWSLLLLALSIWLVDVLGGRRNDLQRRRRSMPLLVFGTNAIAAYVFSELLPGVMGLVHPVPKMPLGRWLYLEILGAIHNPPLASMVYCIAFVGVCWLAIYALYRRRIFLKI